MSKNIIDLICCGEIYDHKSLRNLWRGNLSGAEKDVYFTMMSILNMRKYQEDDILLCKIFGCRESICTMSRVHKDMEKAAIDKLRVICGCKDDIGDAGDTKYKIVYTYTCTY